ncbi:hypothetical protein HDU98_009912 [Podochytrium sp. JEL0797]|nr:hypothetical protein HDU98_009912 [Podochytrium sp. JEL0797]
MDLFKYWALPHLPDEWQINLNRIYFIQCVALIAFCILRRKGREGKIGSGSRWVPCPDVPDHWIIKSFQGMLWGHIIYYLLEVNFSAMWSIYTIVAMHHFFGILVSLGIIFQPTMISVLTATPYFIHIVLWAFNLHSLEILFIYNTSLLVVASFIYFTSVALDPQARPVRYGATVCLMCVSLFFTNYFQYCYTFVGTVCVTVDPVWLMGLGGDEVGLHTEEWEGSTFGTGSYRGRCFGLCCGGFCGWVG